MKKQKDPTNKIRIAGVSLNLDAIAAEKPAVRKGELVDRYFAHLPASQQQPAADALWKAMSGSEIPEDAGVDVQLSDAGTNV